MAAVWWLGLFLQGLVAPPAAAQHGIEIVGVRALGMGGAFVGVADDASAVYWNPAGLPVGAAAGATIGWDWFQVGNRSSPPAPGAWRQAGRLTSVGGWPLGLSQARFQTTRLSTGLDGQLVGDTLATAQWGVTLVQSLTEGFVVGTTLKYVRGRFTSAGVAGATLEDVLDTAEDLASDSEGRFDLDLAFMADMRRVRIGVVLKNLKEPTFADAAGTAITQERRARFGVAILPADGVTLAMDLDLDTVDLRDGLRRNLAVGGESRLGSRVAVRAGVRWSVEGARRLVSTAGGSIALRTGLWVDGYYAHGAADAARGFGVALRAAY
jgi:hypothetical protein